MTDSNIWIFAEQNNGTLENISFELLTRGRLLQQAAPGKLSAMVFGKVADDELKKLISRGADRVVNVAGNGLPDYFEPDSWSAALAFILKTYTPEILLAGATPVGRTLLPYAAMTAHTGLTADCTGLEIEQGTGLLLQTRPAIGGNIMATIKCAERRPQMSTIRPRSTRCAEILAGHTGEIVRLEYSGGVFARVRRIAYEAASEQNGSIQQASRLVVVGRGIKRPENLPMIRELAALLGAAVGATREVVDRGWLDYSHQIGLSGKTVMPDFYLGIGVSGAIQHLAGMRTSGTVVAVNSDPDAPIFQAADFGICANLFDVVPAMIGELRKGTSPWKK